MFDIETFKAKIKKANFFYSKESSLAPIVAKLQNVGRTISPTLAAEVQELVFFVPFDKQQKYADAIAYLKPFGISAGARPVDPSMHLESFRVAPYVYQASGPNGSTVNSDTVSGHAPVHSFHHVFDLKWKSSNGHMKSLAKVGTREHVRFRTRPGGSPFTMHIADTPQEFFHGDGTTADSGFGRDDHMTKPPSLIVERPYKVGSLVAEQWYQYSTDGNKTWKNIEGAAYLLTKGVRLSTHGKWVFYFIKQNWAEHNAKPFHFEVEYPLHEPMPALKPGAKLGRVRQAVKGNISQYGRLVKSIG